MNDIVFTVRLKAETARQLSFLAESTERSKAGVLRYLIHRANVSDGLITFERAAPPTPIESNEIDTEMEKSTMEVQG